MAAAHVFVDDLERLSLDDDDRHHLERVLRLRPGEAVTASDGRGSVRVCSWTREGIRAMGDVEHVARPEPLVAIGMALAKGDRPEWAVQKLTECGVDEIVVFAADRSVLRWEGERGARHVARLRRVAREAAMQCRRVWLPEVAQAEFRVLAARPGAALAERGGRPPSLRAPLVLVGPEGGWSDPEREIHLPRVSLGPHVLRSETAAVAAGVLLCALRGNLLRESGE